ncbi:MAG: flagellar hook-basal body complex protein FliE [Spirochaetaceae bacterium]|nr:MAG: flagellar hook-basal body complex protein FliE [Spirochaetaceae bacterium]
MAVSGINPMQIARTHPDHLPGKYEPLTPRADAADFRGALIQSLEDVNSHQLEHEQLSIRAVVDPRSVEAHDLTIAAAKATTSLSIAKNVVDRVVQAYRDITSLR